ncbi:TraI domain-containing protein [Acidovorax sp. SUPP2522]|uniref:MobH family relaxase n=1 Tax=unclassified Acidovorax TaxID=2684926 RepID=UPI00234AA6D7|nr:MULTISPECIES: MobH family relaxase [unclassified Acidovorax]WCM95735.1 TraI domain-containing protein [Acidovorax sp. GBBC 1281]WCN00212.1 TraI domain-containing protein [Acidovorax sp. GBBC 1281]GKT20010.1 TraI domain-containing protein [Acidovorax sp. SUPP2522]
MKRSLEWLRSRWGDAGRMLGVPARAPLPAAALAVAAPTAPRRIAVEGSEQGWLRLLPADELLVCVNADKAMQDMWRQSRLAQSVWQRDLLPAIHRYAEMVQLMPASEAHHHAHVGGLLAHTLEMLLAAMTWRNGHFLPEGAPIEQIDAERDEWTYVVFFSALLHDIAKPMTDLRVTWRTPGATERTRWNPIGGPMTRIEPGRAAEYLVEFAPKSARDYGAHSRLAVTLLGLIAPATAVTFLARRPQTLEALTRFLSGTKDGLVASIVGRADQASTQRALLHGSRARFTTSNAIPLIDLLMNAVKAMLRAGTALPLNRSGAAGWVHDGSMWFVAKRLADGVRTWIKDHAPEEAVPGEAKNDRLFDTWQEYGCIEVNPHSGQAIWYVTVKGQAQDEAGNAVGPQEAAATPQDMAAAGYSHSLTMLRFPLAKLYDDPSQYPQPMAGRIVVRDKRKDEAAGEDDQEDGAGQVSVQQGTESADAARASRQPDKDAAALAPAPQPAASHTPEAGSKPNKPKAAATSQKPNENQLKAPAFNRPKPKPASNGNAQEIAADPAAATQATAPAPAAAVATKPPAQANATQRPEPTFPPLNDVIRIGGKDDGFDVDDGWLDEDDDVRTAAPAPVRPGVPAAPSRPPPAAPKNAPTPNGKQAPAAPAPEQPAPKSKDASTSKVPAAAPTLASPRDTAPSTATPPQRPEASFVRPLFGSAPETSARTQPMPVVLAPHLPELPHEAAARKVEPSEVAIAFMRWLQNGLASREIKHNETGAAVHFVEEGMALVSPLIFKLYARETGPADQADAMGLQVQRELIKAGWHRMTSGQGKGRVNILRYQVVGRGGASVGRLAAVVLSEPDRWVVPVPPPNPVLKLE